MSSWLLAAGYALCAVTLWAAIRELELLEDLRRPYPMVTGALLAVRPFGWLFLLLAISVFAIAKDAWLSRPSMNRLLAWMLVLLILFASIGLLAPQFAIRGGLSGM